jgi:hypothetical protein
MMIQPVTVKYLKNKVKVRQTGPNGNTEIPNDRNLSVA